MSSAAPWALLFLIAMLFSAVGFALYRIDVVEARNPAPAMVRIVNQHEVHIACESGRVPILYDGSVGICPPAQMMAPDTVTVP